MDLIPGKSSIRVHILNYFDILSAILVGGVVGEQKREQYKQRHPAVEIYVFLEKEKGKNSSKTAKQ